jgi:hypothetical protein
MATNVIDQFGRGIAQGLSLGQNMMRQQELRSQRAMQQLRERAIAQEMALQMQAHDLAIEERAEMSKAMARVQLESMPTLPLPGAAPERPTTEAVSGGPTNLFSTNVALRGQGGEPVHSTVNTPKPLPNPAHVPLPQSIVKNVLPVIAKYRPGEVDNFLSSAALMEHRMKLAQQGEMTPEAQVITDPVTGKQRTMFRTGPNSWQLGQSESVAERQREAFSRSEHAKMVAWVRDKRPDLMGKLKRSPDGILTVPDEIVDEVAKQAGITTGVRADLETAEISADNLFAVGAKLLPLINERTTGVRGEISRALQRTGMTMLFPGLENPEVSEAETVGRTFTASVIRTLRSDGNINKDEVATLERAANTINWTTEKEAKARLAALVERAVDLSRRSAQRKGTPINPLFLTRDEIRERVGAGDLTPTQGVELYTNTADNFLNNVRAELK